MLWKMTSPGNPKCRVGPERCNLSWAVDAAVSGELCSRSLDVLLELEDTAVERQRRVFSRPVRRVHLHQAACSDWLTAGNNPGANSPLKELWTPVASPPPPPSSPSSPCSPSPTSYPSSSRVAR